MSQQLSIRFCPVRRPAWLATSQVEQASFEALGFSTCLYHPPHVWRGTYRMDLVDGRQLRATVRAGSVFIRLGLQAEDVLLWHTRVWSPTAEDFSREVLMPLLPASSLLV